MLLIFLPYQSANFALPIDLLLWAENRIFRGVGKFLMTHILVGHGIFAEFLLDAGFISS